MIGKLFEKIIGKTASVNLLRHSKITDFLKTQRTVKEKDDLACQIAHNRGMQDIYFRVDAESSDEDEEDGTPAKPAPKSTAKAAPKKGRPHLPSVEFDRKGRSAKSPRARPHHPWAGAGVGAARLSSPLLG